MFRRRFLSFTFLAYIFIPVAYAQYGALNDAEKTEIDAVRNIETTTEFLKGMDSLFATVQMRLLYYAGAHDHYSPPDVSRRAIFDLILSEAFNPESKFELLALMQYLASHFQNTIYNLHGMDGKILDGYRASYATSGFAPFQAFEQAWANVAAQSDNRELSNRVTAAQTAFLELFSSDARFASVTAISLAREMSQEVRVAEQSSLRDQFVQTIFNQVLAASPLSDSTSRETYLGIAQWMAQLYLRLNIAETFVNADILNRLPGISSEGTYYGNRSSDIVSISRAQSPLATYFLAYLRQFGFDATATPIFETLINNPERTALRFAFFVNMHEVPDVLEGRQGLRLALSQVFSTKLDSQDERATQRPAFNALRQIMLASLPNNNQRGDRLRSIEATNSLSNLLLEALDIFPDETIEFIHGSRQAQERLMAMKLTSASDYFTERTTANESYDLSQSQESMMRFLSEVIFQIRQKTGDGFLVEACVRSEVVQQVVARMMIDERADYQRIARDLWVETLRYDLQNLPQAGESSNPIVNPRIVALQILTTAAELHKEKGPLQLDSEDFHLQFVLEAELLKAGAFAKSQNGIVFQQLSKLYPESKALPELSTRAAAHLDATLTPAHVRYGLRPLGHALRYVGRVVPGKMHSACLTSLINSWTTTRR